MRPDIQIANWNVVQQIHACTVGDSKYVKQNIPCPFRSTCYYIYGPLDPCSDFDSQSRLLPEGVHPGVSEPVYIDAQQLQVVLIVQLR